MDTREQAAKLLKEANEPEANTWESATGLRVLALSLHLSALDEDLQKLRKELQSRNGGEDA